MRYLLGFLEKVYQDQFLSGYAFLYDDGYLADWLDMLSTR